MSQTKEYCASVVVRSDFWTVWKCNSISSVLFCLFGTSGKKGHLNKNDFLHCCVCVCVWFFFGKWHCESYLIRAMFKLPSQQLQVTSVTAFWEIPYTWIFYGHGSTYVLNLSSTPCKCHNTWRYLNNHQLHKIRAWTSKNNAPK